MKFSWWISGSGSWIWIYPDHCDVWVVFDKMLWINSCWNGE